MKITHFLIVFVLVSNIAQRAQAQTVGSNPISITLENAEQTMRQQHLQLRLKEGDVKKAESELKQSRLWENPQVSFQHNVYNPITKKYFDTGHEGETDIQIEQPIAIGGQHNAKVRKQKALAESQHAQLKDAERELIGQLDALMFDLYFTQLKQTIYNKEIASTEKILNAYRQQMKKGNIPAIEVQRIEAMRFGLLQEQNELIITEQDMQRQLRLMLNDDNESYYKPLINEKAIKEQINYMYDNNEVLLMASTRPDIVSLRHEIKASEHEVKLQKAQALPQLSITGEWDKNGSICHNFFGIGFSVTIPLLNRNQGSIKSAKAELLQSQLSLEMKQLETKAEINKLTRQILTNHRLSDEADKSIGNNADNIINETEQQFLKHNISLLEFIDIYEAYKDAYLARIDAHNNLMQSAVELNTAVGKDIINLRFCPTSTRK